MPTIIVSVKAEKQNDDLLFLNLTYQGQTIEMTVTRNMTLLEMAQLAINQPFPDLPDVVFDGDVEIEFHSEDDYRIADSARKL